MACINPSVSLLLIAARHAFVHAVLGLPAGEKFKEIKVNSAKLPVKTSEISCSLDCLIDYSEMVQQLQMIIATYLVLSNDFLIERPQLMMSLLQHAPWEVMKKATVSDYNENDLTCCSVYESPLPLLLDYVSCWHGRPSLLRAFPSLYGDPGPDKMIQTSNTAQPEAGPLSPSQGPVSALPCYCYSLLWSEDPVDDVWHVPMLWSWVIKVTSIPRSSVRAWITSPANSISSVYTVICMVTEVVYSRVLSGVLAVPCCSPF